MDRDELIRQLMTTFLGELEDHVGTLNRDLLALEKGPAAEDKAELIKVLFRTAHSLKGAARSVGIEAIEAVCHRLEDIFAAFRDGRQEPTADLLELLFATADAIQDAGSRLAAGGDLAESPLAALREQVEAAALGIRESSTPGMAASSPPADRPVPTRKEEDRHVPAKAESAAPAEDSKPPPREKKESPTAAKIDTAAHGRQAESEPPREKKSPAAAKADTAAPAERPMARGEEGIIRVAAGKLDSLVDSAGELLVARSRAARRQAEVVALEDVTKRWRADWAVVQKALSGVLPAVDRPDSVERPVQTAESQRLTRAVDGISDSMGRLVRGLDQLRGHLGTDSRDFEEVAGPMESGIRDLRMVRFAEACAGFDRVVRDLAKSAGKKVELVIRDHQVELDRAILQELNDSLLHLVRNAVDHGIETPQEREAAGKPKTGRISLSATMHRGQVEIMVADDGRGIDTAAIRHSLERKGVPLPDDEQTVVDAVFSPGISTAAIITEVSGRGVGLDIVRNAVESLRGTVDVSYEAGKGTRFILNVPLTLSTLQALTMRVGRQLFAFDISAVESLRRVRPEDLHSAEGREVLTIDGTMVPIVSLASVLGIPESPDGRSDDHLSVVIARVGDERAALVVDELVAEQEIVIKSLGRRLQRIRLAAGAAILPSGDIALILKPQIVIQAVLGHVPGRALFAARTEESTERRKRVLLAEDSVTTRTLESNILEMAGYEVTAAVDGAQAWQFLQDRGADLVVSDIEMPKMDGFTLAETIRASKRFRDLPIVLVTALATDADRARGMEVGADAYLLKSMFDQKELLATIEQLL